VNQAILVRLKYGATAALLQAEVSSNLSRSATGLGPALDRQRCVVLIDDVGAPASSGPQELLRQIVDHSIIHESAASVALNNILAVGALDETRYATPRLLRHFSVFSVGPLGDDSVLRIFGSLLSVALQRNGFASDVAAFVSAASQATIDVVRGATRLQRPWLPHYSLGLSEAHRIILGCSLVLKEDADNKRALVRLWCNEVFRCIVDRHSEDEDLKMLTVLIEKVVSDVFKEQPAQAMEQKLGYGRLKNGRYIEIDQEKFEDLANETIERLPLTTVLFP
jgi:hypothetical protein